MHYDPNDYESRRHETDADRRDRERLERQEKDAKVIEGLLASLRPEDATADLFTFWERKVWGLKHTRKRAKGVNNDHEDDGA